MAGSHGNTDHHYLFKYLVMCNGILIMSSGAVPCMLSQLEEQFTLDQRAKGWLGGITYIVLAISCMFLRPSKTNAKPWLLCALGFHCIFCIAFSATPLGWGPWVIIGLKGLLGVSQAVTAVYGPVWVLNKAPANKLTGWLGLWQISVPIGVVIGYLCATLTATMGYTEPEYGNILMIGGISAWRFPIFFGACLEAVFCVAVYFTPAEHLNVEQAKPKKAGRHKRNLSQEQLLGAMRAMQDEATHTPLRRALADRTLNVDESYDKFTICSPTPVPTPTNSQRCSGLRSRNGAKVKKESSTSPYQFGENEFSPLAISHVLRSPSLELSEKMPTFVKGRPSWQASPFGHRKLAADNHTDDYTNNEDTPLASRGKPRMQKTKSMDSTHSSSSHSQRGSQSQGSSYTPTVSSQRSAALLSTQFGINFPVNFSAMSSRSQSLLDLGVSQPTLILSGDTQSVLRGMYQVLSKPVYLANCIAIAMLFFVVAGIQYWATSYFELLFPDQSKLIKWIFVCVATTGPILGTLIGGEVANRFASPAKYHDVELWYRQNVVCLVTGSFAGVLCVAGAFYRDNLWGIALIIWAVLLFGGMVLPPGVAAMLGSVGPDLEIPASSTSQIFFNILGFGMSGLFSGEISQQIQGEAGVKERVCWQVVMFGSIPAVVFLAAAVLYLRGRMRTLKGGDENSDGSHVSTSVVRPSEIDEVNMITV